MRTLTFSVPCSSFFFLLVPSYSYTIPSPQSPSLPLVRSFGLTAASHRRRRVRQGKRASSSDAVAPGWGPAVLAH